jgi:hypothetical protein
MKLITHLHPVPRSKMHRAVLYILIVRSPSEAFIWMAPRFHECTLYNMWSLFLFFYLLLFCLGTSLLRQKQPAYIAHDAEGSFQNIALISKIFLTEVLSSSGQWLALLLYGSLHPVPWGRHTAGSSSYIALFALFASWFVYVIILCILWLLPIIYIFPRILPLLVMCCTDYRLYSTPSSPQWVAQCVTSSPLFMMNLSLVLRTGPSLMYFPWNNHLYSSMMTF